MNRREFIKTGTGAFFIAAAGRALGDGAPSPKARPAAAMKKAPVPVLMNSLLFIPSVLSFCFLGEILFRRLTTRT